MSLRDEVLTILAKRLADDVVHGHTVLPWSGPKDRFIRVEIDRDEELLIYEGVLSNDDIVEINTKAQFLIEEAQP
ncbi:MAG: hypothetical protein C4321_00360 [Chloroflexota bacterium]